MQNQQAERDDNVESFEQKQLDETISCSRLLLNVQKLDRLNSERQTADSRGKWSFLLYLNPLVIIDQFGCLKPDQGASRFH